MQKHVFITGGTGLLGKEILRVLIQQGYQVTALHRQNSILPIHNEQLTWVEGDLTNIQGFESAMLNCDVIVHSAAKVNFSPRTAQHTIEFNVNTTRELVNFAIDKQKEFVHISSVASLGVSTTSALTSETNDFDVNMPNTAYSTSKYLSEIEVWRGIAEGLQAIIVNPSIILGIPATWKESTGTFWVQLQNNLRYYPKGTSGFVDARDVAEATIQLYQTQCFGERFIINAYNKSYKEFFQLINQRLNNRQLKPLPTFFASILWRVSKLANKFGWNIPYTKELHATVNAQIRYDNQKLIDTIDFQFRPFEESIDWVTKAFKANETLQS